MRSDNSWHFLLLSDLKQFIIKIGANYINEKSKIRSPQSRHSKPLSFLVPVVVLHPDVFQTQIGGLNRLNVGPAAAFNSVLEFRTKRSA